MDGKIAILTDTNSGITPDQAAWYGIYLVAMPVIIDDETYFENEEYGQSDWKNTMNWKESVGNGKVSMAVW